MDLYYKKLLPIFLLCLAFTLTMPVILPEWQIPFFIPFLIIMYYQCPFSYCLWGSLGCGLIVDLLSSYDRLGIVAINYLISTVLLYKQRENFFSDSLTTLPLMTFFFSILSTFIQFGLLFVFDHPIKMSTSWAFHDLLIMPGIDALFAFAVFILPFVIFGQPRKKGSDYFIS